MIFMIALIHSKALKKEVKGKKNTNKEWIKEKKLNKVEKHLQISQEPAVILP